MLLMEKLARMGCDTRRALERFSYDEEFYTSCLMKLRREVSFEALRKYIRECNAECALDHALILKSIITSLELTPLCASVNSVIAAVHKGDFLTAGIQYQKLTDAMADLYKRIEEN